MPQEDPTKIPVHQPLYGTFSPIYPHSASIQSTPAFPPPGLSAPPPPSFYQNPQTYHAIPVGYQTYGAVVEGIPVREPRLPCCGIGTGWFLFLTGFFFAAVPWYVGAFILLFVVVDYREKAGLIACTIGISEHDEGALKYPKDIKWFRINDPKGFKLEFFFDPNPYFKNTVLTKTYHMIDDDEPILEKAIGTEIEWYPGKSLTQKVLKKKPKKGSKNAKPITKTEQCDSFFNFFNPPQVPDDDDDIDEETAE